VPFSSECIINHIIWNMTLRKMTDNGFCTLAFLPWFSTRNIHSFNDHPNIWQTHFYIWCERTQKIQKLFGYLITITCPKAFNTDIYILSLQYVYIISPNLPIKVWDLQHISDCIFYKECFFFTSLVWRLRAWNYCAQGFSKTNGKQVTEYSNKKVKLRAKCSWA